MNDWGEKKLKRSLAGKKGNEVRWGNRNLIAMRSQSGRTTIAIKEDNIIYNKKIIKEKSPRSPKGEVDLVSLKDQFEIFRKRYPGTKRGLDTEFNEFVKNTAGT